MVVDDLLSVIHAAVTDFDCVTIKDSLKFVVFQEMLVYAKNWCPILVLKILLNGGRTRVCCSVVCFLVVSCGWFVV